MFVEWIPLQKKADDVLLIVSGRKLAGWLVGVTCPELEPLF